MSDTMLDGSAVDTGSEGAETYGSIEEAWGAAAAESAPASTPDDGAAVTDGSDGSVPSDPAGDTQVFTVKIDGEDVQVSLDEALAGYARQADYTRKTQALAEERRAFQAEQNRLQVLATLEEAFATDPSGTLAQLADFYGVQAPSAAADDTPLDPYEAELKALRQTYDQRFAELDRERAARQQAEAMAAVDHEFAAVKDKYGHLDPELSQESLLAFAVENGIGNLDMAFRAMRFEAQQAAAAESPAPPVDEVVERKRTDPPVEGGSNSAPGAVVGNAPDKMSFLEAFRRAKQSHGG